MRLQGGQDFFELDFGQHPHLRALQPEAARTQRHLRAAFLAGDIQSAFALALQRIQRLQQQRGFANTGVAANQHHPTFDDAAAQHPVQLLVAGGAALDFVGFNVRQHRHFGGGAERGEAVFGFTLLRGYALNQAVPRAASGALAQPLGAGAAAIGTDKLGFFFSHGAWYWINEQPRQLPTVPASTATGTRAASAHINS